jgi:hypothetical protein
MPEPSSEHSPQIPPVVPAGNPPEQSTAPTKRPVSLRKIEANRKNAQKGTGPKTARGKANSSRNAIKHGVLIGEVLITAGDGQENTKLFHELVERDSPISRRLAFSIRLIAIPGREIKARRYR